MTFASLAVLGVFERTGRFELLVSRKSAKDRRDAKDIRTATKCQIFTALTLTSRITITSYESIKYGQIDSWHQRCLS